MEIDCISDLHGHLPTLDGGDMLIIAGDLVAHGTRIEYDIFADWLNNQKYAHKVVIPGNHDTYLESKPEYFKYLDFHYLVDESVEIEGFKVYGTPWSFQFIGINPLCMAFTGDNDILDAKFNQIPADTDILVTHSPAFGIHDKNSLNKSCGSPLIRHKVECGSVRLHVAGHIHEAYGKTLLKTMLSRKKDTWCVNASIMDGNYKPVNKPIRINL